MKVQSGKTLRARFPKGECVIQVRILTKENNTVDVEGPITDAEAMQILKLALGGEGKPDG